MSSCTLVLQISFEHCRKGGQGQPLLKLKKTICFLIESLDKLQQKKICPSHLLQQSSCWQCSRSHYWSSTCEGCNCWSVKLSWRVSVASKEEPPSNVAVTCIIYLETSRLSMKEIQIALSASDITVPTEFSVKEVNFAPRSTATT